MTPAEQQASSILAADLQVDEGNVPFVYQDQFGFWTIGVGFLIDKRKGGKLYPEEISYILQNRIAKVLAGMVHEPWYPAVANDPVRLAAVMNMQFQLGSESDEEFAASFGFIGKRDWKTAGINLRKSLWASQTPARAKRVIAMIETGRHA